MFSRVKSSGNNPANYVITQGSVGDVNGYSNGNYGSIDVSTFRGASIIAISWNTVSVEYFQIAINGDLPLNYFTYAVSEGFADPLYVNDSRLNTHTYVNPYTLWRWADGDSTILAPAEWDGVGDVTCDIYY